MKGKNSAYTKQYNRQQVLSLLRQAPMPRADLARKMGLTRAAISLITEELIDAGLIRESLKAIPSVGPGRSPTPLELRPGTLFAIGISLGRKKVQIGITDLCGTVVEQAIVLQQNPEGLIHALDKLLRKTDIPREKILGIGISSPGPVDSQAGMILNPPDFPNWSHCPICKLLSDALQLPAYLENDANASALFNRQNNDFAEKDNFLLVFMDYGVGSGVVSQGRLLRFCELGHASINYNGPVCSCGNRGCLEMYASTKMLLAQFPQYNTFEQLMSSPHKQTVLQSEADYLAVAIINLSNIIPIDAVLFDGALHKYTPELLPLIEEKIKNRALSEKPIRLLNALHNEAVPIQSACSIVFSNYLTTE